MPYYITKTTSETNNKKKLIFQQIPLLTIHRISGINFW